MKNSFLLAVAFLALTVVGAPEITNVRVSQDASRRVTVKYDMPDDAAVVTVEFKTNGVAVSSAAACGFACGRRHGSHVHMAATQCDARDEVAAGVPASGLDRMGCKQPAAIHGA